MNGIVCIVLTIIVYLIATIGLGIYSSRHTESSSDFYLGGRKLGPIVTAMSAEASDMSSYLLMGLPGLAYLSGAADVGWTAIGLGVGTYLNWLITAKRLRRYTEITGSITVPQFFSNRFHDDKKILTVIAALVIIVFFIPYTASGFAACGKLFNSLFGINYMTAMLVSAVIIVAYTALGGFLAASTTDLMQSIVMTLALFFVLIFATNLAGGTDEVLNNAKSLSGYFSLSQTHNATDGTASPYSFFTICSTLAWGLGYFGMPHVLLRFMAIEDEKKLKISRRIASIWVFIAMGIAIFIGMIGNTLSNSGIIEGLTGTNSETVIIKIANIMASHGFIPALFAGLVIAGILACTMSTADSQLLAASSSASENILQEAMHLKLTEKGSMLAARVTVIIIAIMGAIIARDPSSSIFGIVSFAWAGFGASFGPLMMCSLFWKRTTITGAISGMITGGVMVFVWKYLIAPIGGIFKIYELLPAFLISLVVIIIVSSVTPAPDKSISDEFDLAASNTNL